MMSRKIPQCSAVDQSEHDQPPNHCQVDRSTNAALGCRNKTESGQRNGETTSSSPESGSLNGDGKRSGKSRRRRKRSSNPESRPEENVDRKTKTEEKPDKKTSQSDPRAGLIGLQSECAYVWFERNIYERAESRYQCWLASSSNGTTQSNRSPPAPGKHSNSSSAVAPSFSGLACHHGDQVACHHVVQAVWVNKTTFDQAERRFVEESMQPSIPNSLDLPSPPNRSIASRTPDEGYQSLAPTPATPVIQQAAVTPTNRQSVNGLPRIPLELLRDVWLEKPLYDRAEAAFYQNLYGNNSSKRSSCTSTSRSSDHPQSLVEEEEEEEDEDVLVEEKRAVQQGKADVFHALHPIQEEEEPAEVPEREESAAGVCYFLHPDSERVWLDKWRYDAAESRFHGYSHEKAAVVKKGRRPEADASSVASTATLRDNTMSAVDFLAQEKIWFDKPRYDEAERRFYERMNGSSQPKQDVGANTILQDIARARENIQKSLAGLKTTLSKRGSGQPPMSQHQLSAGSSSSSGTADQGELVSRIKSLELENQSLHKVVDDLRAALNKLESRVAVLEKSPPVAVTPAPAPSVPYTNGTTVQQKTSAPVKEEDDDDDDIDLFGSDEDDEAEKLKEQRLKEYAEKKAKKPALIAKSSILLDVKPWDDETDMAKLEECVRSVQADGLLWGSSKLVPVGYGIKKLQIACVVEDDKVGTDMLEEEITKFEDYVQSVDVAAFNKI
ncbi:eukaryotic translation elongation factor 1 delta b (guanine nucleotide exchange protein) isoform X2 [Toxotes jaculatrix]|uniref:eukaryotic translation elongation factor 1 delta b (guanine nucleotide exchange protein) isoform X2 n=1 Tax=Toxotes jaculatrix TaxID=941984 RepID=UPI001B3AED89|nr:eukaryotic translation elongation factor 1 delta b (guanine nucleotide exchange protein) isoform X2 [Toxotes jaculatrix]